jgi:hypothetical protein
LPVDVLRAGGICFNGLRWLLRGFLRPVARREEEQLETEMNEFLRRVHERFLPPGMPLEELLGRQEGSGAGAS